MAIKIPQDASDALDKSIKDWTDYREGKYANYVDKPDCALCEYDTSVRDFPSAPPCVARPICG